MSDAEKAWQALYPRAHRDPHPFFMEGRASRDTEIAEANEKASDLFDAGIRLKRRVAELEAVIEKVREKLIMYRDQYLQGVWLAMAVGATIDAVPSVVLADLKADTWDEGLLVGQDPYGFDTTNNPYRRPAVEEDQ